MSADSTTVAKRTGWSMWLLPLAALILLPVAAFLLWSSGGTVDPDSLSPSPRTFFVLEAGERPSSAALSPDALILATGSWDGVVRLRDVKTGEIRHRIPFPGIGSAPISPVQFAKDGRSILTSDLGIFDKSSPTTLSPRVRIWSTVDGALVDGFDAPPRAKLVAFVDDDRKVAMIGEPSAGRFVPSTRVVGDGARTREVRLHLVGNAMTFAAVAPDEATIAVESDRMTPTLLHDFATDDPYRLTLGVVGMIHLRSSRGFQFSPDGRRLAALLGDQVALYNAAEGDREAVFEFRRRIDIATSAAFLPDGKRIVVFGFVKRPNWVSRHVGRSLGATFGDGVDANALVFDIETETLLRRYTFRGVMPVGGGVSDDGRSLAIVGTRPGDGQGRAAIWDLPPEGSDPPAKRP